MAFWETFRRILRVAEPFADIAVVATTFLAATGGLSRGAEGKWTVDHARVKELAPHLFGIGKLDEAYGAVAACLDQTDRTVLEARLQALRPEDRQVFILVTATIPDHEDRKRHLTSLAKLDQPAFEAAINNWRLMQIDTDLIVRIKLVIANYGGRAWNWLQDVNNWRWLRDQARDFIVAADAAMNRAAIRVDTFSQDLDDQITATRNARLTPFNRACRFLGIGGID